MKWPLSFREPRRCALQKMAREGQTNYQGEPMSRILIALLFAVMLPGGTAAQSYPSAPIRVIVPFAPGASTDMLARTVMDKVRQNMGVTIIVENQAGASGNLGMNTVARAQPNGYTLGIASGTTHTIGPALKRKMPFDPIKDFTFISTMAKYISILTVHPSVPAGNLNEFIAYARKNPGVLSYASAGTGSSTHLLAEMLQQAGKFEMTHVPFRGGGQGLQDMVGGHVPVAVISIAGVSSLIKEGKLRGLAVFEKERYNAFPDIPAVTESLPSMNPIISWFGLVGPAGMDGAIVTKLNAEVVKALQASDVRQKLDPLAFIMLGGPPQEFVNRVRDDIAAWSKVVAAGNIRIEQ